LTTRRNIKNLRGITADICIRNEIITLKNYTIMALTIKENNGVFMVEGSINAETAKSFQSHCEMILDTFGRLTIDIRHIKEFDSNGINVIKALYDNALNYDRRFFIEGNKSKALYNEFPFTVAAA
jgi:anti-anti-sigma regulatory factor